MTLVLYHQDYGYYSKSETDQIGRRGDFITSVSVGDLFGTLLSHRIESLLQSDPEARAPFAIIEQGGHDGQLAIDICRGLEERGIFVSASEEKSDREGRRAIQYRLIEPRPRSRERLRERFEKIGLPIEAYASAAEARCERGVFLCNELLDAFPCHRIESDGQRWWEIGVASSTDGRPFTKTLIEPSEELSKALAQNCGGLPDAASLPGGYETELCLEVVDWIGPVADLFERGEWWIIDYGHEAGAYFDEARKEGTIRGYRQHEAIDDPLQSPGQLDITSHVNWTLLIGAARQAGLEFLNLEDQHHFLIEAAKPWLAELDGRPPDQATQKLLRQFQTLTHPQMMGRQFQVASFRKG
ncbi:MAG: SAM-dependent methyltransferase [Verrucomicrobiota bacterium]